jgi:uncharacterized membrane protein YdjX (TVP38/TMEM64 family)
VTTSPRPDPLLATAGAAPRFSVRRLVPLVAIVLATGAILALGWHRALSLETLVRHHGALHDFIVAHKVVAIAAFMAIYVAIVALSIPAATFLTVAGGSLFGLVIGPLASIFGATIGATCIFLATRTALGEHLVRRAGPLAGKLADGFRADAFHYLLFLRLVPVFPFFIVNIVPAVCGVRLRTFVAATAIGIIPGTFTYAFVGAGLDSVIRAQAAPYEACLAAGQTDCHVDFDLRAAVTPELLAAFVALGMLALVPILVKRVRARARLAGRSG